MEASDDGSFASEAAVADDPQVESRPGSAQEADTSRPGSSPAVGGSRPGSSQGAKTNRHASFTDRRPSYKDAAMPARWEDEDDEGLPVMRKRNSRRSTLKKVADIESCPRGVPESNQTEVNGHFIDFLRRIRERGCRAQVAQLFSEALKPAPEEGLIGDIIAMQAVQRESLFSLMLTDISEFWKLASHPDWLVPERCLQNHIIGVVEMKRYAQRLKASVHRRLMRRGVVEALGAVDDLHEHHENADERYERLKQYWPQLHETRPESSQGGTGCAKPLVRKATRSKEARGGATRQRQPPSPQQLPQIRASSPVRSPFGGDAKTKLSAVSRRGGILRRKAELEGSSTAWAQRTVVDKFGSPAQRGAWDQSSLRAPNREESLDERLMSRSSTLGRLSPSGSRASPTMGRSLAAGSRTGTAPSHLSADTAAFFCAGEQEFQELIASRVCKTPKSRPQSMGIGIAGAAQTSLVESSVSSAGFGDSIANFTGRASVSPKKQTNHRWWEQPPYRAAVPERETRTTPLARSETLPLLGSFGTFSPCGFGSHTPCGFGSFLSEDAPKACEPLDLDAFVLPWGGGFAMPNTAEADSPSRQYLRACKRQGIVPSTIPFTTGHSTSLHSKGNPMTDADLAAVSVMMKETPAEEVDLGECVTLSEAAIIQFVSALHGSKAATSLKRLCLRRVQHAGQPQAMTAIIKLLTAGNGLVTLRKLDLGGIALNVRSHVLLCSAIQDHPSLQEVSLAGTGLGGKGTGGELLKQCVNRLLGSSTVRRLDLSWNCFGGDAFLHIGRRVAATQVLQSLELASCASAQQVGDEGSPVSVFLETLASDKALTRLDVSLNRIDFRGALILEDALEHHGKLREIITNENPMGSLGLRSLCRLLAYETSGLTSFKCQGCSGGKSHGQAGVDQVLNTTNPAGTYSLDFSRTYHRALLRMLYKFVERLKFQPDDVINNIVAAPAFSHLQKDATGIYQVPQEGTLRMTVNLDRLIERDFGDVPDQQLNKFLVKYYGKTRRVLPFKKEIPFLMQWCSIEDVEDQRCFLEALSKDFQLTSSQLEQMCQGGALVADVLGSLLPFILGGAPSRFLATMMLPSVGEYTRLLGRAISLLTFNIENPTGHYKLDLGNAIDYAVAEQVVLLDMWEASVKVRRQLADTSQFANNSQVRNPMYHDKPLQARRICEWIMPDFDILELDYTSCKRPSPDATEVDDEVLSSILLLLQDEGKNIAPHVQLQALGMAASFFYLTALQMRELMGLYREAASRANLFIMFFNRVVDMHNEKLFRVRFATAHERRALRERLGKANYFPFIQPEGGDFELDVSKHDERIAAAAIIDLANKECTGKSSNLTDPSFLYPDGKREAFTMGVPKKWTDHKNLPQAGFFCTKYVCSPDAVAFPARKQLLEQMGCWHCNVEEEEVLWWASLDEANSDVLSFLYFLTGEYTDLHKVFLKIDGEGGNGVINKQEFLAGFETLKCKKFKGKDEQTRIINIFRFLDPSGEGEVSKKEWDVLSRFWNEIRQSIREFVMFCERSFGTDLDVTWEALDASGDGEVDLDEWNTAVQEIGFFGASIPIFRYLDADEEGTISRDEFMALKNFQGRRAKSFVG